MPEKLTCPSCHGTDVQKASAVWEQGTSRSSGGIGGVVLTTGGVGIGVGATRNAQASLAAARLAPPVLQNAGCLMPLILGAGAFLVFASIGMKLDPKPGVVGNVFVALACLAGLGIPSVMLAKANQKAKAEFATKAAHWDRLWYCIRCGHAAPFDQFEVSSPDQDDTPA